MIGDQLLITCNKYKSEYSEINSKNGEEGGQMEDILYKIDVQDQEISELKHQTESFTY